MKKDTAIVKSKDYALEKFMLRLRLNTMPKRREANLKEWTMLKIEQRNLYCYFALVTKNLITCFQA